MIRFKQTVVLKLEDLSGESIFWLQSRETWHQCIVLTYLVSLQARSVLRHTIPTYEVQHFQCLSFVQEISDHFLVVVGWNLGLFCPKTYFCQPACEILQYKVLKCQENFPVSDIFFSLPCMRNAFSIWLLSRLVSHRNSLFPVLLLLYNTGGKWALLPSLRHATDSGRVLFPCLKQPGCTC